MHGLLAAILVLQTSCASSGKNKVIALRKPLNQEQTDRLLKDVNELQFLAESGQARSFKRCAKGMLFQFPQIAQYELKDYIKAEQYQMKHQYSRAARKYQQVIENYPDTELRESVLDRLFNIGYMYVVEGRKRSFLWIFRISGYETGIKVLEVVSEAEGLEKEDGLGLKGALIIADHYENHQLFEDAYLKWLEISTVWQDGELGRRALLGMAENKRASYNANPVERRHLFDASSLKASKTYFEKYLTLFPEDPKEQYVMNAIQEITEQIAYKELTIGQFYNKTGQTQAANIYYDMVIQNWPKSQAAETARETMDQAAN